MATRAQLKQYFLTGAYPTQGQFATLIDSFWHKGDDTINIANINGLADALGSKATSEQVNLVYAIATAKETILPDDSRLTVDANYVYTLQWNEALAAKFGTGEATFKVLFDNGDGGYKEQKGIAPIYYYTGGVVSTVVFEIIINIQFKIIITR